MVTGGVVRSRQNAWHVAIREQLRVAKRPLSVTQIFYGVLDSGFKHKSEYPRATLCARITELVKRGELERVGPATYQIVEGAS